jgi:hypothetical protein
VPGSDRAQKAGFVPGSRASCFLAIYKQEATDRTARGGKATGQFPAVREARLPRTVWKQARPTWPRRRRTPCWPGPAGPSPRLARTLGSLHLAAPLMTLPPGLFARPHDWRPPLDGDHTTAPAGAPRAPARSLRMHARLAISCHLPLGRPAGRRPGAEDGPRGCAARPRARDVVASSRRCECDLVKY